MTPKVTVRAPANIAFIKYWGALDLERTIPANPSLSMTLEASATVTTVSFDEGSGSPHELLHAHDRPPAFQQRVFHHLDRILERFGRRGRFLVATENSFPSDAGLASSASGFAALALAAAGALGLELSPAELSTLALLGGSGSAARSVLGGYVQWPEGPGEDRLHAVQVAPALHWDLRDVIALADTGPKTTSSRDGHRRAATSPHYAKRLKLLPARLDGVRRALQAAELSALGPLLEQEAIELHLIAMSSEPPIFYWAPATLAVMETVRRLRAEGVEAWFTMDAGANVHVITLPDFEDAVAFALERTPGITSLLRDRVGEGPRSLDAHLF